MRDHSIDIHQLRAGSREAFRDLVEAFHGLVYQFVHNMVSHAADAEDLTQDVFLAAFRARTTYDPERGALSTWLLTIARNRCVTATRRLSPDLPGAFDAPSRDRPPDVQAAGHEIQKALDDALDRLPRDQRAVFVLAEIQERPLAEIARIEGVELGTVKSRLSRARDRLRQILQEFRPSPAPHDLTTPQGNHDARP